MEGNSLVENIRQWPADIKSYVVDLQMEMRRVTWPARKQVQATTAVVVLTVFGFAAYFFVVDAFIGKLISWLITSFTKQ